MKGSRFSETQIFSILKEAESGSLVKDICRKYGISDATYYNWKSKYGGMVVSDLQRMKEMESELGRLNGVQRNGYRKDCVILFWFLNIRIRYGQPIS